MTMVGNLTYKPLHYNDKGVLVDDEGKPVNPPTFTPPTPPTPPSPPQNTDPNATDNKTRSGHNMLQRIPEEELKSLSQRDRLEYEIDYI
jgi:hypothetical protein